MNKKIIITGILLLVVFLTLFVLCLLTGQTGFLFPLGVLMLALGAVALGAAKKKDSW